jgi:DNA-binding transcriptional regulator YhcF (GntR family)
MRFWFARNAGVPIREQLVTQVILGILCDDLAPEERLPSTRELARRFRLHPNTVSSAYRQLEKDRWIEFRRGSGVYVRKSKPQSPLAPSLALDQLIANLFRSARELGISFSAIQQRLRHWLALEPPDHFLLIEPDDHLRAIVLAEMRLAAKLPVVADALEACASSEKLAGAIPVCLLSKAERVRQALPAGTELLALPARSVLQSLDEWLPAPPDALVGVISGWPGFLSLARTILTAAGFPPDSMVFRNSADAGWQRGLKQLAAVVCDSLTAAAIPRGCRVITFPLLSEAAVAELRAYEQFVLNPPARKM